MQKPATISELGGYIYFPCLDEWKYYPNTTLDIDPPECGNHYKEYYNATCRQVERALHKTKGS